MKKHLSVFSSGTKYWKVGHIGDSRLDGPTYIYSTGITSWDVILPTLEELAHNKRG